ncbi:MAG: S-ribosylhomocysteine lyase [Oscillospiraceae bacterium]|nr:S-ribosylhomocysteine lyase [Oscillospiraceae bacterium]
MGRIVSFYVGHTKLKQGMYLSRIVCMKGPNQGDYLENATPTHY